MGFFAFGNLRLRLILLVLLAVLPALGVTLYSGLEQRRQALEAAKERALDMTRELSNAHKDIIDHTHQVLFALSQLPQVREQDAESCSTLFARLLKQSRGPTNIVACDINGESFASVVPLKNPLKLGDRPWFQRALQSKEFVIGEYQIGRIKPKAVVILAYPLLDDSGQPNGVLNTALDLEWLSQFIAERMHSKRAECSLMDRNGTVLAHFPHPKNFVGKSMVESPIFKAVLKNSEGVAELPGMNGVTQIMGFTTLRHGSEVLYVVAGIPKEIAFADADRSLRRNLGTLGLITLLAIVAAWLFGDMFVVRPVHNLLRVTKEVEEGNMAARTDSLYTSGELGRLARAFDQMAESLQQREIERRQVEESLRESEERYRQTAENIREVLWMADAWLGKMIYVNPAYEAIWGQSCSTLYDGLASWTDAIHPDDRERVREAMNQMANGGYATEYRIVRPDGSTRWIWDRGFPIHTSAAEVYRVAGIAEDITERKLAEENRHQHYARINLLNQIARAVAERQDMRSLFRVVMQYLEDQLPVDFGGVYLCDPKIEDLVVMVRGIKSQQLSGEGGTPEGTLLRLDADSPVRPFSDDNGVYLPHMDQIQEPHVQNLVQMGLHSLAAVPLAVENKVFGFLLVARNERDGFSREEREFLKTLSEHVSLAAHQAQLHEKLQQAYDELRETQQTVLQQERLRALGQMASGIAHDINNALAPIIGYTDLLLQFETDLSDRVKKNLQAIKMAGRDIAETVAGMREFYRTRDQDVVLMAVNLNRLVKEVVDLTRPRWKDIPQEHGIVIDVATDLEEDLPFVPGAESEIRQALTNLILNAVDSMPQGGSINLRTSVNERNLFVEVTDTGIGMDEEMQRRCLEPFYTAKGERGTGLGLAMVYGVMQRHEGLIDIESEPGIGTRMRLVFPLRELHESVPDDAMDCRFGSPLRVLCIDDEMQHREVLEGMLEHDKHHAEVTDGGQAGLDAFRASMEQGIPFDVVISDLGMPYVDGREVAKGVKQMSPSTPVILLTGWGRRMNGDGDTPPQVDYVASKPITVSELRKALHHVMRTSG